MTSKERLERAFNNEPVDRVPVWPMFPYFKESFAADVNNLERYRKVVACVREKTDYIERISIEGSLIERILFSHPDIIHRYSEDEKDGTKIITVSHEYNDMKFEKKKTVDADGKATREYYLKNIEDLEMLMKLPFKTDEIDMKPYRTKIDLLGDKGIAGISLLDPISFLHDICSEMDFVMWVFEKTETVGKYLDMVYERCEEVYSQFLEKGVGFFFWITGPEYLTPPLAPPEIFRSLVTAYDKKLIQLIRQYGKKSFLHCHGNIRKVLVQIKEMAPDALHPIESSPPNGDCTLSQARAVLGEEIVLVGNIQYSDLYELGAEDIAEKVKGAIREGGARNFILSPTCSPYETDASDKVLANYINMIEAGLSKEFLFKDGI